MLYTFFLIIFGVYIGQEFNVPNIRDYYMILSERFLDWHENHRHTAATTEETEEETVFQQMLKKVRQNLAI